MPLKHNTETWLVILLGCMIALAGVVCAFLPPISVSVWPWVIAFAISVAYPLLLYPMLRERRADYPFRMLHFVPALMLLVWLILELLASALPVLQILQSLYTLWWSALSVITGFMLLIIFCFRVVRQRLKRIALLLGILLPFLFLGVWSDHADWDRQLTAALWDGEWLASLGSDASGNLLPSTDPFEEQWRVQLRLMEQRRLALLRGESGGLVGVQIETPLDGVDIASGGRIAKTDSGAVIPPHLPSSGFGAEALAILFLAGASTALHRRTIERGRKQT